ncbi:LacI family DNA-binding transcriptional regulator [Vibrio breoganii]|uniref:LacI family DNA-binding transcriptional regulator n=1 Tax=Vibrio breoganii TaxID=553239 RepID=UPI000C841786|nr:LacI family DNA-binding transcriptional regulator [Vibrio breoganii]PMK33471.1 LacI family transcriptional regulator [Vibrio breoganii]PMM21486.1 LacI family transcriptional regulator [Vibrio breoganii]PMO58529.1 LacI family transcriptional regulator [Vibrio breoganii]
MKKVRIVDVATQAGVSKSTVSQYLNGRFGHMSPQTKLKIESAIKELNYVPNPIARSLKVEKTKTIGVVVRDIAGFNTSRVMRGIDDYCKKHNYNVMIYNSDFDVEAEKRALLSLQQMCVDGIIITSSGQNSELINQFISDGMPIVQFQLEYPDCHSHLVLSDYQQAAFEATEHLIEMGHRNICFVAQEFSQSQSRQARYQGYVEALEKHGIEKDPDAILYWDREQGFEKDPIELLKKNTASSAFFTQHLAITAELLQAFNTANIQVPEQASVLGFDEIPMVELFKVPVSVVRQDAYQIGVESAKLSIESITGKHKEFQRVIVPSTLVKRDSVRRV